MKTFFAQIRGAQYLPGGRARARALHWGERLILLREKENAFDPNAIILLNILGKPVGWVAKEIAARLAPRLDSGEVWLAKKSRRWQYAFIWRDDTEEVFKDIIQVTVREGIWQ